NFHTRVGGRTAAGDLEFGRALQHDLYRLAAGLLRELRRGDAPGIIAELAAKAASNVLLLNSHIGCWDLQLGSDLLADAGDILSGEMKEQAIFVGPFGDAAMALEAAVSDDRLSVETFGDDLGFLKGFCGIALGGFGIDFVGCVLGL